MSEYSTYFFFILPKDVQILALRSTFLNFSCSVEEKLRIALFEHRDFTKKRDFTDIPRKKIEHIDRYVTDVFDSIRQADKPQLNFTYIFEENSNLDIGLTIFNRTTVLSVN